MTGVGSHGDVRPEGRPDWRARVRRTRGGRLVLRGAALVVGVSFIALGLALVVLPGPLTLPPVLLGLYVLSTEFAWADRLLHRARASAGEAWEAARARPVSSAAVTLGGLVLAAAALWAVAEHDLVSRGREAVGL